MAPGTSKLPGEPAAIADSLIFACPRCRTVDHGLVVPQQCRKANCRGHPVQVRARIRCAEGCAWEPVVTTTWVYCTGTTRGQVHRIDVRYRKL
jgi:hypothetical protein